MPRTFLSSPCHAMVSHYLLSCLPSCLLLLLHLSPPVRSCPVCRQLSQLLPVFHLLPMLVHLLPVTIHPHHLTPPPLTASSWHSCVPCISHLSSLTHSYATSMYCCPLPPFLTQHKPLLLLLAFTTCLNYPLSRLLLPACSCHRLLPMLVNMSFL